MIGILIHVDFPIPNIADLYYLVVLFIDLLVNRMKKIEWSVYLELIDSICLHMHLLLASE